jgi:MFS transporter, SHS family, sialic acid transporter
MKTIRGRWLALAAALLGWMFDGLEMGLFPLVAKDALAELLGPATTAAQINDWFGIVMAAFLVGAATGGVVFGWLGDKIGRVRAMSVSVLLYSLASGLSAFSAEPWHLAALRFLGALGMGGEWALGVALVMEVWADKSRVLLAGLIGAFGNLGYTLCGLIGLGLIRNGVAVELALEDLGVGPDAADFLTRRGFWRMLMLLGAVPALLTFVIRLFVPESEQWQKEKHAGRASHWSTPDLAGVLFGSLNACAVIVLWMHASWPLPLRIALTFAGLTNTLLGYLFPAYRYLRRSGLPAAQRQFALGRMLLAAGLSGAVLLGTWSGVMWQYQWVGKLPGGGVPDARAVTQIWSSLGAAVGALLGAALGGLFGRRVVYAGLCVASAFTIFSFYQFNTAYDLQFLASAAGMGLVTAAFYGWLPLYLPELFPTAVRATGQGFGFNFGRILAAVGNLLMPSLLAAFDNDYAQACAVVPAVYLVGLVLIAFAPETKGRPLPQ